MNNSIENQQIIFMDILHNQDHYRSICKPLLDQKKLLLEKHDKLLHNDIENNFLEVLKSTIAKDMHERSLGTIEDCLIVLEQINLKEYING